MQAVPLGRLYRRTIAILFVMVEAKLAQQAVPPLVRVLGRRAQLCGLPGLVVRGRRPLHAVAVVGGRRPGQGLEPLAAGDGGRVQVAVDDGVAVHLLHLLGDEAVADGAFVPRRQEGPPLTAENTSDGDVVR